ncbi:MAG: helix-turn-helix domain-containing protein [Atopobiaceae bacterium]|nr:helix-turn-helix domain-containing protein [Atopobiaceae bacterium]
MRIAELMTRLPEGSVESTSLGDPECEIHNVSFLTQEAARAPHDDVIYFSDGTNVPEGILDSQQFSCVIANASQRFDHLGGKPNVNLVRLRADVSPFACYNAVQAVFVEERDLTAILRRLLDAHFSNRGLQNLIDEAAAAFGLPIVVVDPTYRYIAYQLGDLSDDDTQLARVMEAEIANETILDDAIDYIRDQGIDSELAHSQAPYVSFNELLACNTMTSAVMVQGVCVAHIMMMERRRTFTPLDQEAFARLAGFVAQEMQKTEMWGPTSGEMGSFFLNNLITDRSPSEAVTRRRMKALHFHPKGTFFLVCLHAPGEGLSQLQAEHVAGQLRPLLHHALYTRYHQQLVLLLSRDYTDHLSEAAEKKLREISALNRLTVGVSNPFTSITETGAAYDQARVAIRLGDNMSKVFDDHGIYHYSDLSYAHLFDIASRRADLMGLCHPALLKLVTTDERKGSELAETLFCYLQVGCSTPKAAKLLNIHKNTLLYRIGKISDMLGLDLSSGEDQFILQVGFRILLGARLFTPRLTYDRSLLREQ